MNSVGTSITLSDFQKCVEILKDEKEKQKGKSPWLFSDGNIRFLTPEEEFKLLRT